MRRVTRISAKWDIFTLKSQTQDQEYMGHFSLLKYSSHQFLLCFQVNVKFYAVTKWLAAGQYSEKTK